MAKSVPVSDTGHTSAAGPKQAHLKTHVPISRARGSPGHLLGVPSQGTAAAAQAAASCPQGTAAGDAGRAQQLNARDAIACSCFSLMQFWMKAFLPKHVLLSMVHGHRPSQRSSLCHLGSG